MARVALGKRTRSTREADVVEPPSKRTRRQTRSSPVNDENADPAAFIISEDCINEAAVAEITEESLSGLSILSPLVSKSRSRGDVPLLKPRAEPLASEESNFLPLTPNTPRFRNALATTPVTPRHRVMSAGRMSKRTTPQTPLTPAAVQTVYHHARQLFSRSAAHGQLIGRKDERQGLQTFLQRCSTSNPSGCIYVSGPPGTGKSAMINEMMQEEVVTGKSIKKAYINCMSIKSSKDLYATLLGLVCDKTDVAEADAAATLLKLFVPRKKSSQVYVVVLDEIDHILNFDLESLYQLFEWSMQKAARLVLIGIANALDLTDRFLPRLKSRNLRPSLLPFLPYSAAQIKTIITTRLQSLVPEGGQLPFFHPAAIEFCARKVSSQTGDLRKAFEICRRAIDLVETETRQKHEADIKENIILATPTRRVLGENVNLSSPSNKQEKNMSASLASSLKSLTIETAPRVTIAHLSKITAATFSVGTNQRLRALNLQQKAALCSLVAIEKRSRARKASVLATPSKSSITAPTIKLLYETYCRLCTEDSVLHPLSSTEFREVVGSLETLSLVSPVDGRAGSLGMAQTPSRGRKRSAFGSSVGIIDEKSVASCVGEKEMEQAVEGLGAGILRSILNGDALD